MEIDQTNDALLTIMIMMNNKPDYSHQPRAIKMIYAWFRENKTGNVVVDMPGGSGKSHVIAMLCKDILRKRPEMRILMLVDAKELIEQNADKMRQYWPNAPLGIYSASLRRRDMGEPITFAGIQSVRNRGDEIGFIDLVLIDECHMINNNKMGGYRTLLEALTKINKKIRLVGLTASPFRLNQGLLTEGDDALFTDIIAPTSIEELVYKKVLYPLRSKITDAKIDITGVHKRGGEYIEKELQAAVDVEEQNIAIAKEIITRAEDRRSWLIFCTGIVHAEHMRDVLRSLNITAEMAVGKVLSIKKERERLVNDFKSVKFKAMCVVGAFTKGFDFPGLDLIAMLRPTLSSTLYLQMVCRGTRRKDHTDHCLVLDFAGVVAEHGPITAVKLPKRGGDGTGDAPVRICAECGEICHAAVLKCPACGYVFPPPERPKLRLRNDDIMGIDNSGKSMDIAEWKWQPHKSAKSGKDLIKLTYYGGLGDKPISEYLCVYHEGRAGDIAKQKMKRIVSNAGWIVTSLEYNDKDALCNRLNLAPPPTEIKYKKNGKFFDVVNRIW